MHLLPQKQKLHKLKDIIGGSAKAVSDSYNQTTQSSLDYLKLGHNEDGTTKNIEFTVDGKKFTFPIMSLFPPPVLSVKEATFNLKVKIHDIVDGEILVDLAADDKDTTITFKIDSKDSTIAYHNLLEVMNKMKK